jgi:two-component system response regulator AtoC
MSRKATLAPLRLASTNDFIPPKSALVVGRAPTPSFSLAEPAMRAMHELVARVAPSNIGLLIVGETGVGKELVAETAHRLSGARADEPFVRINCAALNESLFESELFGHERGAFTGAQQTKLGLLESAERGTVFLDEIGELPLMMQPKLLRAIESREITRVGGLTPQRIDVRFIAATNRDLRAESRRGSFREDLFFRLSGMIIRVPALRERRGEIRPLAQAFVAAMAAELGVPAPSIAPEALKLLERYEWPGNVRELRNAMESAVLLTSDAVLEPRHLPAELRGLARGAPLTASPAASRARSNDGHFSERDRIMDALAACNGNQTRAAEHLRMPRRTLVAKLITYDIPRPRKPALVGRA